MSNKNKNGQASGASKKGKKAGQTMSPPGSVGKGGHGLQGATLGKKYGVAQLRDVLSLSGDVSVTDVCEEAALEIERLQVALDAK